MPTKKKAKINPDTATTVAGAAGAVLMAAGPTIQAYQQGTSSLKRNDYVNLGVSAAMALMGFFSNRGK